MALPVFAGGSSTARSLAPAGHKPQGLWLGEWREGRLLPITHTAGSVPATRVSRGRAKSLSTFCHSRLPTSHHGESCYHLHLTNEGAAGLPTQPAHTHAATATSQAGLKG